MLNIDKLKIHQNKLENHSLLVENHISNKQQLATFMEHHVYCVWDFMSLVKGLQNSIAPSSWPWQPSEHTKNGCARLLNDIIKTEESDYIDGRYLSHFDLYLEAMEEIGADNTVVKQFVNNVFSLGLFEAMNIVPEPVLMTSSRVSSPLLSLLYNPVSLTSTALCPASRTLR